ncbi:hypothetical protein GGX14DRAFT_565545 [Mycena pura]|uniref:Uncharacterized protein n=1 Tax=Mycena pura TaxID=153505 RepID=A0AAD6YHH8_9AGAR|nr:hypothetical protein GGX14DRAFT_565545 [Mycena pura]
MSARSAAHVFMVAIKGGKRTRAASSSGTRQTLANKLSLMGGELYDFDLVKKALDKVVPQPVVENVVQKKIRNINIEALLFGIFYLEAPIHRETPVVGNLSIWKPGSSGFQ